MWLGTDLRSILLGKIVEKGIDGAFLAAAVILNLLLIQAGLEPILGQPRPAEGRPIQITVQIGSHLPPPSASTTVSLPLASPQDGPVEVVVDGSPVGVAIPATCGDVGSFRTVVFADPFNWAFRETATVELNGEVIDFRQFLRGDGSQRIMASAEEIVAVGTASCEGLQLPFRRDAREEKRAQERAAQLSAWIQEVQPPGPEHAPVHRVHTLNLGRYERDEPCDPQNHPVTRQQRKVMLVAVLRRDPALGLAECLKEGFGDHDTLKPLITRYSKFALDEDWTLLQGAAR
jgi:hypothetical protein